MRPGVRTPHPATPRSSAGQSSRRDTTRVAHQLGAGWAEEDERSPLMIGSPSLVLVRLGRRLVRGSGGRPGVIQGSGRGPDEHTATLRAERLRWSILQPLLRTTARQPRADDRRVLNGICRRLRRALPGRSRSAIGRRPPAPTTSGARPVRRLGSHLRAVSATYDGDLQMINSSSVRCIGIAATSKSAARHAHTRTTLRARASGTHAAG